MRVVNLQNKLKLQVMEKVLTTCIRSCYWPFGKRFVDFYDSIGLHKKCFCMVVFESYDEASFIAMRSVIINEERLCHETAR